MATRLDIYNMALAKTGSSPLLSEGDARNERLACERLFPEVMRRVAAAYPWRCLRRFVNPARLAVESSHPDFKYIFILPGNLASIVKIRPERTPYEIAGTFLYCSESGISLEYTAAPDDYAILSPYVEELAAIALAAELAPLFGEGLTAGRQLKAEYLSSIPAAIASEVRQTFTRPPRNRWTDPGSRTGD